MKQLLYNKKRVANFCDAVFSIAMTLLVLEIDVPSYTALNKSPFGDLLGERIPNFIGLFVSFMVLGLYWISHLRIFQFVTSINERLIWINLLWLLFVVLLPFSTAIYVGGFFSHGPFVFYCLNLVFLGFFNFLVIHVISKKEMGNNGMTPILAQWLKFRSLNALFIWLLAAILAFVWPWGARIVFVLIFIVQAIGDRHFAKKTKLAEEALED